MKVGVLGAGRMGGTIIEHLKECNLVSDIIAQDVRETRLTELREEYDIEVTGNVQDVLRDSHLRCVFITASNDAHAELSIAALKAGKAVFCEKPMATTSDDALAMVKCAAATGGFLQIGFELRYSRLYSGVKDWIDQGLLGDVVNTQFTYIAGAWEKDTWRSKGIGGGMFGEKLSHYVDLPRWWIDSPVTEVYAASAPNVIPYYQVHDNYHATYRFQNGAVSQLTFMTPTAAVFEGDQLQEAANPQYNDGHSLRYLVQGTRGVVKTNLGGPRTLKRFEFRDAPNKITCHLAETVTWDESEDHLWCHNTHDQAHDVVRRVQAGLPPKTPASYAYETMRLCFAAEQSVDSGKIISLTENK